MRQVGSKPDQIQLQRLCLMSNAVLAPTTPAIGQTVRIKVPQWYQREKSLATRVFEGEIERISARGALFIKGHASFAQSDRCHRCSLTIENPVSILVGYGPICSDYLGIPRDFSPEEIEELRQRFSEMHPFQDWVPARTQILEVLEDAPIPAPTPVVVEPVFTVDLSNVRQPTPVVEDDPMLTWEITVRLEDGQLVVRQPRRLNSVIKSVPGCRFSWDKEGWTFPATRDSAKNIAEALRFENMDVDEGFTALLYSDRIQAAAGERRNDDDLPNIPGLCRDAWTHQRQAFWFVVKLFGGEVPSE